MRRHRGMDTGHQYRTTVDVSQYDHRKGVQPNTGVFRVQLCELLETA